MAVEPSNDGSRVFPKRRDVGWSLDYKWAAIAMETVSNFDPARRTNVDRDSARNFTKADKRVDIGGDSNHFYITVLFAGQVDSLKDDYKPYLDRAFPLALWGHLKDNWTNTTTFKLWDVNQSEARDKAWNTARTYILQMVYALLRDGFRWLTDRWKFINEGMATKEPVDGSIGALPAPRTTPTPLAHMSLEAILTILSKHMYRGGMPALERLLQRNPDMRRWGASAWDSYAMRAHSKATGAGRAGWIFKETPQDDFEVDMPDVVLVGADFKAPLLPASLMAQNLRRVSGSKARAMQKALRNAERADKYEKLYWEKVLNELRLIDASTDNFLELEKIAISLESRINNYLLTHPNVERMSTPEIAARFMAYEGGPMTMTRSFKVKKAINTLLGRDGAVRVFDRIPPSERVAEWPQEFVALEMDAVATGAPAIPIGKRLAGAQGQWQNYYYKRPRGQLGVSYMGPGSFEGQPGPQSYNFAGGLGLLMMHVFETVYFGGPRSETKVAGVDLLQSGKDMLAQAVINLHRPYPQFQNPDFYRQAVDRSAGAWIDAILRGDAQAASGAWFWLSALLVHRVVARQQFRPPASPFSRSGGLPRSRSDIPGDIYQYAMYKVEDAIRIGQQMSEKAKRNIPWAAQYNRPIWLEKRIQ